MRRAMRHAHLLGAADPLMHRLVPTLVDQMGEAYPELAPRPGLHRRHAEAGGDPLPHHPRPRHGPAGRGDRGPCRRRRPVGPDRLHPVRHLRLPARPDPGRGPPSRPDRRHRRLRGRHGASSASAARPTGRARARPPRPANGWPCATASGPTVFTGYDAIEGSGEVLAIVRGGESDRRPRARPDRRGPVRPDPLLRRRRRPGRRPRRGRMDRRLGPAGLRRRPRRPETRRRTSTPTRSRSSPAR